MDSGEAEKEKQSLPKWIKPNLQEEMPELERTAVLIPSITLEELKNAFNSAELRELTDEEWVHLDGVDDLGHDPKLTIEQVRAHLKDKRDFAKIEQGLRNGEKIPAPVVLSGLWNNLYLIGGNSRLLGCRALGIRPMVLELKVRHD